MQRAAEADEQVERMVSFRTFLKALEEGATVPRVSEEIATAFTRLCRIRAFVKGNFLRSLFQRRWEASKSSLLGEWLAPVIAWLAVMLMSMALVGLLLGKNDSF